MVFNSGNMSRSFTYIDDVVELVFRLLKKPIHWDENFNKRSQITPQVGLS